MSEATYRLLEESLGRVVLVRLKGNRSLRGRLKGFDQHLNLVLEDAEDISNPEDPKKLGGVIIVRGDNVVLISPAPE
ncbi:MAG TPA: RNA-binding protein [Candidatus Bathyarchaeota archaeon]|nr:RNA-binding protein [Candidatus Bathyarchaeota archaeon]